MLARDRVTVAPDCHDIEARHTIFEAMALHVMLRGARDLSLFARVDDLERVDHRVPLARLHLDEHQHPTIEGYQVDLAEPATVIARQDDVALPAQKFFGHFFAMRTKPLSLMRNRAPRVERVRPLW